MTLVPYMNYTNTITVKILTFINVINAYQCNCIQQITTISLFHSAIRELIVYNYGNTLMVVFINKYLKELTVEVIPKLLKSCVKFNIKKIKN